MDYIDIPSCALLRHGTVIVRLRMEVTCGCGRPSLLQGRPQAVHRLTKCEQCSRTRTISQYSDCDNDSGLVDRKCRPYRRSAARIRYVNFCAAACLILLAGGLCRSSAAPASDRSMDNKNKQGTENPIWANPCDTTIEINRPKYTLTLPESLSKVAGRILRIMNETMKDDLAQKLVEAETFERALPEWKAYDWMDKFMALQPKDFREKALFPEKQLGRPLRDFYDMEPIMKDIDNLLPYMYKASKMILAGMVQLKDRIPVDQAPLANDKLKENYISLTTQVRGFNCALYEIVSARRLAVLPLLDDEIPDFLDSEGFNGNIFLLFRDTMVFLEYMKQVADSMQTSLFVPKTPSK